MKTISNFLRDLFTRCDTVVQKKGLKYFVVGAFICAYPAILINLFFIGMSANYDYSLFIRIIGALTSVSAYLIFLHKHLYEFATAVPVKKSRIRGTYIGARNKMILEDE